MEATQNRAKNLCIAEMCPICFSISIEEDYFKIDSGLFHSYEELLFIKNKLEQLLSQKNIKEDIKKINKKMEDKRDSQHLLSKQTSKSIIRKLPGHVYFLQDDHNRIKIGKTKNLSNRIFGIGLNLPVRPKLFHSIETDNITILERHFHSMFKKYRLNGEWFDIPQEELLKIQEIERL